MRKIRFGSIAMLFICTCAILLCGCSKKSNELASGTYMVPGDEGNHAPVIKLNMKDKTFKFTFDALSSYLNLGTIKVEDDKIIGTTDDKKYTFIFKVIDKETIAFVEENSASTSTVEGKIAVKDGTKFKRIELPKLTDTKVGLE